jgi:hypothetical protein
MHRRHQPGPDHAGPDQARQRAGSLPTAPARTSPRRTPASAGRPATAGPASSSGGIEVVRRAMTVVMAQALAAATPTVIPFQSSMACGVQRHPGDAEEGHAHSDQGESRQALAQQQEGEQGSERHPQLGRHGHRADVMRQPEGEIDRGRSAAARRCRRSAAGSSSSGKGGRTNGNQAGRRDGEAQGAGHQGRQGFGRHLGGGVVHAPDHHDRDDGEDLDEAERAVRLVRGDHRTGLARERAGCETRTRHFTFRNVAVEAEPVPRTGCRRSGRSFPWDREGLLAPPVEKPEE